MEKQEGNGPLDSRAKVMISDKIFGLVYLKSETIKLLMHIEFLKVKFLKTQFLKLHYLEAEIIQFGFLEPSLSLSLN